MRVGDEIEIAGYPGKITWATSEMIDVTMSAQIGPIGYEKLARASRLALSAYQSDSYVFTLDRNAPILRDLKYLGSSNEQNKCCCGGDTIGATRHPHYCPKYAVAL